MWLILSLKNIKFYSVKNLNYTYYLKIVYYLIRLIVLTEFQLQVKIFIVISDHLTIFKILFIFFDFIMASFSKDDILGICDQKFHKLGVNYELEDLGIYYVPYLEQVLTEITSKNTKPGQKIQELINLLSSTRTKYGPFTYQR